MLRSVIEFSLKNKMLILLFISSLLFFGLYSLSNIPIGAVPDVTNNQVQVISTTRDLSTEDVEKFLTYPVELEMSNLPGVKEIRSISKFGLSVVTVVFEDDMGTYLPRQLISEKINKLSIQMPYGLSVPFMGPISTGLGEIYQYTLDVTPEYKSSYSVEQLRSIQDWIVKRQLSGISGVVEVNTWGGYLKTFEIALNPHQLKAMSVNIQEVYKAVKDNNGIAGGGYIEKNQESYFIRADGLAKSKKDLENIVIKTKDGVPIYVRDVAVVNVGHATRFGAITGNGEGEKVLGQVMMLKGANSKKVISAVEQRVSEIQTTLPPGIYINPLLSRTELINKTTFTVSENLILGFLIVLFVVIILLGNVRSGLIVASVIPLTLFFALSMMYIFNIDANLMSLGAIDFGIIIDGAVIIVEYLTYLISHNRSHLLGLNMAEKNEFRDNLILKGSSKMMHSAVFGQIIIMIVFIPILTLSGIEGKMFRPMGLTFCFALFGAMILCFTYVPVMASLFLKENAQTLPWGIKLIDRLKVKYTSLLHICLNNPKRVLGIVILLLGMSIFIFSRMGGEFVPTLDEGDFVIQPILKTGMSLSSTVQMTTRIEKILKKFPEVKQVVSRIGAAEVPTDPMSMEESDIIITLIDKSKWTSAETKDALADVFKSAIMHEIPNIEIEFTQPIEMRFNELISGARSDLVIKIFGEDLKVLYSKAAEIEKMISNIPGAEDITIEKIDGLPQLSVIFDRVKMDRYGININDVNEIIEIGFAGKTVGLLNEGERQFDIKIRYAEDFRTHEKHIEQSLVTLPNGTQVPLGTFAQIKQIEGPAKISRDNTKRRVVIGVNIRGRDLQSVVDDVQKTVDSGITLANGYYIRYGGQFENLNHAKQRLMIAVPIALVLIFVMLYFAFRSFKDSFLIFSAIPLSAIGGIMGLYVRDMPFSISAGVGFIALFGIAVLNGIVLIEHFTELKSRTSSTIKEFVIEGATNRLRPVLLTAIAATFGFLPMAISTSAGAEIQRPLATVVIGGLISSTLLTLIVLPILYMLVNKIKLNHTKIVSIVMTIFVGHTLNGQNAHVLPLESAILLAQNQSIDIMTTEGAYRKENALIDAVSVVANYDFYYAYDFNNINENGQPLHVLGSRHTFKLPSVHASKKAAKMADANVYKSKKDVVIYDLAYDMTNRYQVLAYLRAKKDLLMQLDSIYAQHYNALAVKKHFGASTKIDLLNYQQKSQELKYEINNLDNEVKMELHNIKNMTNAPMAEIFTEPFVQLKVTIQDTLMTPLIHYQDAQILASQKKLEAQYKESLPEFNVSIFGGIGSFSQSKFYPGIELGISIPLSKKHLKASTNALSIEIETQRYQQVLMKYLLNNQKKLLLEDIQRSNDNIDYFENTVLKSSDALLDSANEALQLGEINYTDFLLVSGSALEKRIKFIDMVYNHNLKIISYQFNK